VSRLRALTLVLAGLALGGASTGCSGCSDDPDCVTACEKLSCCGLLESPLGVGTDLACPDELTARTAAEQDCVDRCTHSEDSVRKPVLDCATTQIPRPPTCALHNEAPCHRYVTSAGAWNSGGACDALATCLASNPLVGPDAIGQAEIDVTVTASGDAGAGVCGDLGIETLEIGVLQEHGRFTWADGCPNLVDEPTACASGVAPCEGLTPGPAQVFLIVRGVVRTPACGTDTQTCGTGGASGGAGGAGGSSGGTGASAGTGGTGGATAASPPARFCRVLHEASQVLSAGVPARQTITLDQAALDEGLPCEDTLDTCTNGQDDDADGLTDCQDPKCAALCVDAGATP
jgi:hypothetical protein